MSAEDVQRWLDASVYNFASQLSQASGMESDLALRKAESILVDAVPEGGDTPGHSFRWILSGSDRVGKVWFGPRLDVEGVIHIWDIGVEPAYQGRGFGGSAIDLIVEEAGTAGSVSVTLNVFDFNRMPKGCTSGRVLSAALP